MQLKNLLFSLQLHLSVDNKGLHINARECLSCHRAHSGDSLQRRADLYHSSTRSTTGLITL